jgi:3-oxoacyl-[acyl-carrier-protein] synthase II
MMKAYIRSAVTISPQKTFNDPAFLNDFVEYNNNRLTSIEPDYNEEIDPRAIRRMSRIIKMSVASALACLKEAEITKPDAIVTGTAYGCLEDTGIFLTNMVQEDEEPVTPVAFVQATHNTIGAQVALLIKCSRYNNTFVSGGASFENALLDSMMLLSENDTTNVLVGGMDEITDMSHAVLSRMGLYKRPPVSNVNLFNTNSPGTINGEGAAFFLLENTSSNNDLACIDAVATFYKPKDIAEIQQYIDSFLASQLIKYSDIDLVIVGKNGDKKNDAIYMELQQSTFNGITSVNYKHLCGEYPTSTSFAAWVGAKIIKNNNIPVALGCQDIPKSKISKVLIYNHYQNIYHSFILMSSC